MTSEQWRASCQEILDSLSKKTQGIAGPEIRIEGVYKCDVCGMEFSTCMKLGGMRHVAIQNKCGGMWHPKLAAPLPDEPGMNG